MGCVVALAPFRSRVNRCRAAIATAPTAALAYAAGNNRRHETPFHVVLRVAARAELRARRNASIVVVEPKVIELPAPGKPPTRSAQ